MVKPVYLKADSDDFFKKLQKEVHDTLLTNPIHQRQNSLKSIGLLGMYAILYGCILLFGNSLPLLFVFYVFLGWTTIILFINSFHDAVHGAVFKKRAHNRLFTHVLELFGSNNFIWSKRHLLLHHPYPNVQGWDIDVKQSEVVHLFPDSPFLAIHRYQHLYMWFLYPLYTLNWLFIRDFKDFFGRNDNYLKRVVTIPRMEYVKLFLAKAFNIFYLLILPMLVLKVAWYMILAAWFLMHISASLLGVIALISTHVDEEAVFPLPGEDGALTRTWAIHQMTVTKDFSTESKVANFLFGGFTHHVAHHLFPGVAHTYYPEITKLIRKYALEYGLPYQNYNVREAIVSHYYLLKKSGKPENILQTGEL